MAVSLASSSRYTKFVRSRNKALERIHIATQLKVSSLIHDQLFHVKQIIRSNYSMLTITGIFTPKGKEEMARLEQQLHHCLDIIVPNIIALIKQMRKAVYVLTVTSEAEAIGLATDIPTKYNLTNDKVQAAMNRDVFTGGSIEDRIQLAINRLIRKVLDTVELSAIREMPENRMLKLLSNALPKTQTVSTHQKNITVKKLKEANDDNTYDIPDMSSGYIDDQTWNEAVQAYTDEYIPSWRGPDNSYSVKSEEGNTETIYGWEVEKDINHDFVTQVRNGQNDAANENGITDYQWIAIIDDKTDDCCAWRDGLTTKEIEAELNGDHSDDDCDAIVPPAHFSCATAGHDIITDFGIKKIEDIQPGDKVLTHNNRFMLVERCLQSLAKETLLITLEDSTKIRVTKDHPLMTDNGWKKASDLKEHDAVILSDLAHENDSPYKVFSNISGRANDKSSAEDHDVL